MNKTLIAYFSYQGHTRQADMSYNTRSRSADPNYNRWEIRFQLVIPD